MEINRDNIDSLQSHSIVIDNSIATYDSVISVNNLTKIYKLYDSHFDRLKEAVNPFGTKYHKEFFALNDISMDIKKGNTVGLIGMNGAGKSTLLKVITGVLTPTSGNVKVKGKISALLELGAGFNPELTGVENVYFNGALMGYSSAEMDECIDDILSFADIGDFVYQPVKMYSSGMFVRLAFAVAINVNPDILIIDEALSVGDIKFQRKCFAKIEQFHENNKTILFVSHGLDTVNMLCNYAYLLSGGKIIEQGEPKNVTRVFQAMSMGNEIKGIGLPFGIRHEFSDTKSLNTESNSAKMSFNLQVGEIEKIVEAKIITWDGCKKAEIIECGILDKDGNKVSLLHSGSCYTFYSIVLAYEDIEKLHVGFPITNAQGLLIFSTNSGIQNVRITPQSKGDVILGCVDVCMWLAPGNYFLSFRAGNLEFDFDELNDHVHFIVIGDSSALRRSIVNLQPKVSINKIYQYAGIVLNKTE